MLGSGAFQDTKCAICALDGLLVAASIIRENEIQHSDVEARIREIWGNLMHIETLFTASPHAVHIFGITRTAGKIYAFRELCPNDDLNKFLHSSFGQGLAIGNRIAMGIAFAKSVLAIRAKGILHLDLKPANAYLILGERGKPIIKIGDFGAARLNDLSYPVNSERGTTAYSPPERASLLINKSAAFDIRPVLAAQAPFHDAWSLGIILFQIIHPRHELPTFAQHLLGNADMRRISRVTNEQIGVELANLENTLRAEGTLIPQAEQYLQVIRGLLNVDMRERMTSRQAYSALKAIPGDGAAP